MSAPFSWLSPVFLDELDLSGARHNSRFAVHVERAQSALFEQLGRGWTHLADRDPDLRYVVRELHVEFLAPLQSPGALLVVGRRTVRDHDHLWIPNGASVCTRLTWSARVGLAGPPWPASFMSAVSLRR